MLRWTAYQNTAYAGAVAAAVFVGVAALLLVGRRLVKARLSAIAVRTATGMDDFLVDLVVRTRPTFLVLLALYAASFALVLAPRLRVGLGTLLVIAALVQAALWGNGLVTFWLRRYVARRGADTVSQTTIAALGFAVRFFLWVIILLVALGNLGVNVTALVTGLGIVGVAVALAVQNILGDLLAALSIVLDKPFEVGDFIVVDAFMGTVEHVGLKSTRIASLSGEQIIISNADVLKSRIRNFRRMTERRVQFAFSLEYGTPADALARVPAMLREIISEQPQTRFDRAHLKTLGPATLDFEVVYFVVVSDYNLFMDLQQAINLAMVRRFAAEKIRFGFPVQAVRMSGALGVHGPDGGQVLVSTADGAPDAGRERGVAGSAAGARSSRAVSARERG